MSVYLCVFEEGRERGVGSVGEGERGWGEARERAAGGVVEGAHVGR